MKSLHIIPLLLLTAFIFTGCAASKTNGTLSHSGEITRIFESATIVPDHTYYYTGPQDLPDAIIGIDNSYTLQQSDKNFWVKVDISEKMLRDWNIIIDNERRTRSIYYGYAILTPDGRQVGIWYSRYRYTVIKFPAVDIVVIYTPELSRRSPLRTGPFGPRY
jgi:hypothetical protein